MKQDDIVLLDRIRILIKEFSPFSGDIAILLKDIEKKFLVDFKNSILISRTVVENLLNRIFAGEMKSEIKNYRIGYMLGIMEFKNKLDNEIVLKINAIRSVCNFCIQPGNEVFRYDSTLIVKKLCDILEWYLSKYKKDNE